MQNGKSCVEKALWPFYQQGRHIEWKSKCVFPISEARLSHIHTETRVHQEGGETAQKNLTHRRQPTPLLPPRVYIWPATGGGSFTQAGLGLYSPALLLKLDWLGCRYATGRRDSRNFLQTLGQGFWLSCLLLEKLTGSEKGNCNCLESVRNRKRARTVEASCHLLRVYWCTFIRLLHTSPNAS